MSWKRYLWDPDGKHFNKLYKPTPLQFTYALWYLFFIGELLHSFMFKMFFKTVCHNSINVDFSLSLAFPKMVQNKTTKNTIRRMMWKLRILCFFRVQRAAWCQPGDWWSCWGEAPTHYSYSQLARNMEWWEMVQCRCVSFLWHWELKVRRNLSRMFWEEEMPVLLNLHSISEGKCLQQPRNSDKSQTTHAKYSPFSAVLQM